MLALIPTCTGVLALIPTCTGVLVLIPICTGVLALIPAVFSLTLARSPMASRFYQQVSDFLKYSPSLASDILAEAKQKSRKKKFYLFFQNLFPQAATTLWLDKS